MEIQMRYGWHPKFKEHNDFLDFLESLEKLKSKLNRLANDCYVDGSIWEISISSKYDPSKRVLSWGFVDKSILVDDEFVNICLMCRQYDFLIKVQP